MASKHPLKRLGFGLGVLFIVGCGKSSAPPVADKPMAAPSPPPIVIPAGPSLEPRFLVKLSRSYLTMDSTAQRSGTISLVLRKDGLEMIHSCIYDDGYERTGESHVTTTITALSGDSFRVDDTVSKSTELLPLPNSSVCTAQIEKGVYEIRSLELNRFSLQLVGKTTFEYYLDLRP